VPNDEAASEGRGGGLSVKEDGGSQMRRRGRCRQARSDDGVEEEGKR
jgi:hypothetical protein